MKRNSVSTSIPARRPRLNKLMDRIQTIIKQDNYSLTQLSMDIRKDLSLVHRWVVTRNVEPGGEVTLQLLEWANNRPSRIVRIKYAKPGEKYIKPKQ